MCYQTKLQGWALWSFCSIECILKTCMAHRVNHNQMARLGQLGVGNFEGIECRMNIVGGVSTCKRARQKSRGSTPQGCGNKASDTRHLSTCASLTDRLQQRFGFCPTSCTTKTKISQKELVVTTSSMRLTNAFFVVTCPVRTIDIFVRPQNGFAVWRLRGRHGSHPGSKGDRLFFCFGGPYRNLIPRDLAIFSRTPIWCTTENRGMGVICHLLIGGPRRSRVVCMAEVAPASPTHDFFHGSIPNRRNVFGECLRHPSN